MEKLLFTSWTCSISINLPVTFALAVNIFFKNRSITALGATGLSPLQLHAYGISYPFISEPLKPFYPSRNLSKLTSSCQQHFLNCFSFPAFGFCNLFCLSALSTIFWWICVLYNNIIIIIIIIIINVTHGSGTSTHHYYSGQDMCVWTKFCPTPKNLLKGTDMNKVHIVKNNSLVAT